MDGRLYFRQLLSGRDFAADDMIARQMVNFSYLIGDRETGEAVAVDPAYDVAGLFDVLDADGMNLVGVLATHYHADHIGGSIMGYNIEGIAQLLERAEVPIHLQEPEVEFVTKTTGLGRDVLTGHHSGDVVPVGHVEIELIHTPGHTPGSQCFLVRDHLVSGDTLFLDGCGRTDLPGGDTAELYRSLTERLAKVPDSAILYPGHLYSPEPSRSMGDTRALNAVYRPRSLEQWLMMFGQ
jgi:glyoxylase-like metal-dependent hydrolase (beta-lactamase superfamily II)